MEFDNEPPLENTPKSHEEVVEARLVTQPGAEYLRSVDKSLREPKRLHASSILFGLLSTLKQFAFAAIIALFLAGSGNRFAFWAASVAVLVTSVSAIFRYLTLRYSLVEGDLKIDEGLIFRRHRVIPAKRIQNVDLLQNPVHHMFGVAEVRIETAGGSEPEAKLRVLSLDDVETLRRAIFRTPQTNSPPENAVENVLGGTPDSTAIATNQPAKADRIEYSEINSHQDRHQEARLLYQIPLSRLILAGLISNRGFVLIPIVLGFFYQFDMDERIDLNEASKYLPSEVSTGMAAVLTIITSLALLLVFRVFSVSWYLLRFYGYKLERRGDDLRISCGLFTRVSATVPRRRIQFISIHQTVLGRWFGLAAIRIETAGGVGEKSEDAASTVGRRWFVPVICRSEIDTVVGELRNGLRLVEEDLQWQATSPQTARRLTRIAILRSFLVAAVGGLVIRPWGALAGVAALILFIYFARRYARSLKYAREHDLVLFRSGILTRKLSVTFFDKVQAVAVTQSPFDRRWDMATLSVDTAAAGPAQHRIEVRFLPSPADPAQLTQPGKPGIGGTIGNSS